MKNTTSESAGFKAALFLMPAILISALLGSIVTRIGIANDCITNGSFSYSGTTFECRKQEPQA